MVEADLIFRGIFGSIVLIIGIVIIVEGIRAGGSQKTTYIAIGISIMLFSILIYLDAVPRDVLTFLLLTQ